MEFSGIGKQSSGKIDGVVTIKGGVYDDLDIDGVCTVEGDLETQQLKINGVCTCHGSIAATDFSCDGVLTVHGNVCVTAIDIDGVVTINGGKLEADKIVCDGVLTTEGEISADVIKANGKISAREIVGDDVTIKSYWSNGFTKLLFKITEKTGFRFSQIDLIEATTVDLRGVRAKVVNGRNVTIGKNCEIGRVDCSGQLKIDASAIVREITGEYTMS
ncbi:MAG: hypothetical protein LBT32_03230 [Peptococcaceae bacterium]|jgi:cytoskeletal protein CcmA (bactofilin family)|nr:hypothetical protein [Peptococcaceae bacterium]